MPVGITDKDQAWTRCTQVSRVEEPRAKSFQGKS